MEFAAAAEIVRSFFICSKFKIIRTRRLTMTYRCLILSDKFKTAYGMTHTPKGEFYMDENRTYLKVWANGKHLELLQLAVQMFNEESTDFDVEISVEEKTGSEIKEELSTCLREEKYEDMPDIVLVDDAQMKFYLENYCEYFHCFENLNTDDFNIFNNHNYFAEKGWEKYAVPHTCNPFALYYNVDILEDCGIDVAELTDWESFREAGQKLKVDGYYLLPALDWYAITAFMYSAGIDLNFESEDRHEIAEFSFVAATRGVYISRNKPRLFSKIF